MNSTRTATGRAVAASLVGALAFATVAIPSSTTISAPLAASSGSTLGRPFAHTPNQRTTAEVTADYSSIFAGQIADAVGSGWAACSAPIVWNADTHELTAAEASREVANLQWAFGQWSRVSGLAFTYGGTVRLGFRESDFSLTPTDGSTAAARQIYLDFIGSRETSMLGGSTVGLGSPSKVMMSSKEIQAGAAVFRTEHIESVGAKDPKAVRSLYLHELGHVLGLAHASMTANVMYPVVTDRVALGAGDVRGVQVMTKPCATTAAPAPAPAALQAAPADPAPTTDPAPTAPVSPTTTPAPTAPTPTDPPAAPETAPAGEAPAQ